MTVRVAVWLLVAVALHNAKAETIVDAIDLQAGGKLGGNPDAAGGKLGGNPDAAGENDGWITISPIEKPDGLITISPIEKPELPQIPELIKPPTVEKPDISINTLFLGYFYNLNIGDSAIDDARGADESKPNINTVIFGDLLNFHASERGDSTNDNGGAFDDSGNINTPTIGDLLRNNKCLRFAADAEKAVRNAYFSCFPTMHIYQGSAGLERMMGALKEASNAGKNEERETWEEEMLDEDDPSNDNDELEDDEQWGEDNTLGSAKEEEGGSSGNSSAEWTGHETVMDPVWGIVSSIQKNVDTLACFTDHINAEANTTLIYMDAGMTTGAIFNFMEEEYGIISKDVEPCLATGCLDDFAHCLAINACGVSEWVYRALLHMYKSPSYYKSPTYFY